MSAADRLYLPSQNCSLSLITARSAQPWSRGSIATALPQEGLTKLSAAPMIRTHCRLIRLSQVDCEGVSSANSLVAADLLPLFPHPNSVALQWLKMAWPAVLLSTEPRPLASRSNQVRNSPFRLLTFRPFLSPPPLRHRQVVSSVGSSSLSRSSSPLRAGASLGNGLGSFGHFTSSSGSVSLPRFSWIISSCRPQLILHSSIRR